MTVSLRVCGTVRETKVDYYASEPAPLSLRGRAMDPNTTSVRRVSKPLLGNVLVVDDAVSNRKMLSRLLRSRCREVEEARDGLEAVDIVKQSLRLSSDKQFDLILIDFVMPVMDGPTATALLRSLGYEGLIFGLTGNVLPSDVDFFRERGADHVLHKPFDLRLFDQALARPALQPSGPLPSI